MTNRRWVLGGATVAAGAIAALLLREVVATVFFAMTVAYVLGPVRRRLRRRGHSRRVAAGLTSLAAFLAVTAVLAPLVVVLVVRIDGVIGFIESVPETATMSVLGFEYTVVTADVSTIAVSWVIGAGTAVASAAPVLLIKLALFAFVVYGLLSHENRTRHAVLALVPPGYRDLAAALDERARRTLYGLYVVQAATGFATFLVAIPVFVAFGYPSPIAFATLAGVLQFVPVVGPSVLIVGLAGYEITLGDPTGAVWILLVGGTFIAAAPDLLIRPRLAAETAELPGTLYFIGFVGGVLTVGPVGIIAGPLAVAVAAELATQLSTELNGVRVTENGDEGHDGGESAGENVTTGDGEPMSDETSVDGA
ncbi:AI-2E family transporter [Halorubrum sp. DTA98]|uniref:AI-2E family transporter n=1 Tax=Halorubrum sp. DTA98 TaxID=3402163 RepID=UPI003AAA3037